MATLTPWLLFLHVLAALWLAGGAFAGAVVRAQTKRAKELPAKVLGLRIAWRLVTVCAIPGSLVAGVLGLAIVGPLGYGFEPGWVHASLGIWLLALGAGLFYSLPWLKKTLAAAEASLAAGAPSDELKRLTAMKAPGIVADLQALSLVLLTLLMVLKPF
ncbi:MAG: DUF2269 family protein [Thermoanaerobaculia bacterium]|nr:DUF2269 family protein [Thermoanaerobaculia bacterium]